ncbi:MAG TPA: class III poly(R)-hydroxyalkanoic acid synthase subunit PhaC [Chloroflexia bacterium]|nr:class III poly(R)-hydroxyalkanoic acid synthase subunit PhaC [Chloroflexia bacterium]
MSAETTSNPDQSPDLAQRYQHELELALKRYTKAMGLLTNPPEVAVGQSPKEVIWTRNKARLYHYLPSPKAPKKHAVPLLFVYALINKPYVLDLRPGASLIQFLLERGYEIYLLDWGVPGPEDSNLTVDDYVLDYIPRAVKHTLRHAGAKELSILGYCLGGTLLTAFAALHPEMPIKNLIMMAAPLDFASCGLFQKWLDPKHFNVDQVIKAYGNMPAEIIDFGTKLLKPYPNFIGTYVGAFDKLWDDRAVESWLSMQKWVNDGVPFAGAAFKQWIKDFYQENKLTTNRLVLRGRQVKLENIKANLLVIVAQHDHIALPEQSKPLLDLVSSPDKELLVLPAGHVGLVVGRSASKGLWPALDKWLGARSS